MQLFPNQQHRSAHISHHGTPHKLWHLCSTLQIYFVLLLFSYRLLFNTLTLIWQTLKQRWLDESDFFSTSRQSFSINSLKYINAETVHTGGRLHCFVWYFGKMTNLCYWQIDFHHSQNTHFNRRETQLKTIRLQVLQMPRRVVKHKWAIEDRKDSWSFISMLLALTKDGEQQQWRHQPFEFALFFGNTPSVHWCRAPLSDTAADRSNESCGGRN